MPICTSDLRRKSFIWTGWPPSPAISDWAILSPPGYVFELWRLLRPRSGFSKPNMGFFEGHFLVAL